MKIHQVKTLKEYYVAIDVGVKTFELRKNDRNYKAGDILHLMEYENNSYTGNQIKFLITYVLENCPQFGLVDGYCVLGIARLY